MEIEAFKQGDAVSSCGYTVKGLCGWQIRHLYSSQQHHPSDGKPAPKPGMYAHTCYVLVVSDDFYLQLWEALG